MSNFSERLDFLEAEMRVWESEVLFSSFDILDLFGSEMLFCGRLVNLWLFDSASSI